MLRRPVKPFGGKNGGAKEMVMTRTDVRKLAWTLRLVGYGLLMGAAALMFLGSEHASAAPAGRPAAPSYVK
jgi:hypothetical protein